MHHDEYSLVKACLKGKRQAQQALYTSHKDRMYALCLRYARCNGDAEDMLQEGFLKVFRDLHQYRPEAPLGAWIRKVMVNAALEHIRKHRNNAIVPIDNIRTLQPVASEKTISELNARELIARIAMLPDEYRLVFNLFAIEGYSHAEIAVMLDISVANSKVRLNRARGSLRKTIEETNEYLNNGK